MKLRSKLFGGFAGVLGIVLVLCITLSWSLSNVTRMAKIVDNVDSGLATALVAQANGLRFLLYRDPSYLDRANANLKEAGKFFDAAKSFTHERENLLALEDINGSERAIVKIFSEMNALETSRRDIEARLVPLVKAFDGEAEKLRQRQAEIMQVDNFERIASFERSTAAAKDAFDKARLAARVYVWTSTPENEKSALAALENCAAQVNMLDGLAVDAANQQSVKVLLTTTERYAVVFRELITNTAATQAATLRQRDAFQAIESDSMKLSRFNTDTLLGNCTSSQMGLFAGIGLLLVLSLGIVFFLTGNVLRQLGKDPGDLVLIARRVTDGDYNIDDGSSKIGVYGNLVAMVEALREHIDNAQHESARAADESDKARKAMEDAEVASRDAQSKTQTMLVAADRLEEIATVVSSASTELAAQIEQSERGAAQQAARVTETATAMEEMNSTVLEVARSAGNASDSSSGTRDKAEAGAKIVAQTVQNIRQVQKQSLQLKDGMVQLDDNAKSINQIMSVISDIADQTNLLALNAAIEAARAGDAGRGFAVVADEVRNLAEKTMASTTDVGNAIKAIQQSVAQSKAQVESSVIIIEQTTELANQSGQALEEIVSMADGTADQVRAIATASEQQSASSEEISRSISEVNGIANETARAMQEAAHAVSDLARQAQALSGLIENMKRG